MFYNDDNAKKYKYNIFFKRREIFITGGTK